MATTFGELIEAYGVPRLLIANRLGRVSDAPYLLISAFISIPTPRFKEVQAELEAMDIVARRPGTRRGPLGGITETVEVAIAADAMGLGQKELDRAIAEWRVLNVSFYRSMGDGYVTLDVGDPHSLLPDGYGYHFVFEPPCRLLNDELPYAEAWNYESARDYLELYWQRHFIQAYPLPADPVRASRARRRSP